MMTQRDRVQAMLTDDWTCGTQFLARHIPRYGARIFDLRRQGLKVERRPCETHQHFDRQYEWRLL